jgi:hypothetical protein
MTYLTTWQTEDGHTHRATVTGDSTDGFEIRSDCGIVGYACWEKQLDDDAEITCPRCRSISGKHLEAQTKPGQMQGEDSTVNGNCPSTSSTTSLFEGADLIHVYTRKQAIEDGVLIDVTTAAWSAGFRFPVALTAAVWGRYVQVPEGIEGQDEIDRLWDVLWTLRQAIRQGNNSGDILVFSLLVWNDSQGPLPVQLKATCGPNDNGSPCMTIMLPDED